MLEVRKKELRERHLDTLTSVADLVLMYYN